MVFLKLIFIILILLFSGCTRHYNDDNNINSIIKNKYYKINKDVYHVDKYTEVLNEDNILVLNSKNPIKYLLLNNDILYVRIDYFNKKVVEHIEDVLNTTIPDKIILDLRNNGGGLLDEAMKLVDVFIDKGIIISIKGRSDKHVFIAHEKGTWKNNKITILVNSRSASASEIVAGVLQYYNRAIIIGEKTYGKSTIQELINIDKKKILKITVEEYFIAGVKSIEKVGITPDISIVKDNSYYTQKGKNNFLKKVSKQFKFQKDMDNVLLIAVQTLAKTP